MLTIINDALTDGERLSVLASFDHDPSKYDGVNSARNKWIDVGDFDKQKFPLTKIINLAKEKFDLSSMAGVECWAHYGVTVGEHVDKDERCWTDTGIILTPLCSIVYYADIQNLVGGRFLSTIGNVVPKTNSLIMFPPRLMHAVEPMTSGVRNIIAINPWSYKVILT
jgi:hypothetical protein